MQLRKSKAVVASVLALAIFVASCNAGAVQAYINLAVQIAIQVAQLAGAPQQVSDKVAADLATANKLFADYKAADAAAKPGKLNEVDTYLTIAQKDLDDILAFVGVKDEKTQKAVRTGIAIAIMAVESVRALEVSKGVGGSLKGAVSTTARVALPGGVTPNSKTISAAQLKAQYNAAVAEFPQAQLR